MKRPILTTFLLLFLISNSFSQGITDEKEMTQYALRIYLDCAYCDIEYFKTNFTDIDYVIERKDADVYVLVTGLQTGSGGMEYQMMLKGQGRFKTHLDTLAFNTPADATDEVVRSTILKYTKLALVPYLLKSPVRSKMELMLDQDIGIVEMIKEDDPWRNWMFLVDARGSYASQKTGNSLSLSGGLYISKVNEKVKFESSNSFSFNEGEQRLYDDAGDSLLFYNFQSLKDYSSTNIFVRSLGNHAGIGGMAAFEKSDFRNIDRQFAVGPAFEYNVYSYEDATQKQFRFLYSIIYEHTDYLQETMNGKLHDYLFSQKLQAKYMYIGSWGEVNINAFGTNYLNDWRLFSAGVNGTTRIYLGKGLSFDISCGYSIIQNQINVIDPEDPFDIYTDEIELQTDYSFYMMGGISFRFGSIFNNVVNPRFGP
jgi:hypothetical protein